MRKLLSLVLMVALLLSLAGFGSNEINADEVTVGKPKISLKSKGDSITVTVKKTENAEGYNIYIKGSADKKYYVIASIEANSTGSTKYTIENLTDDEYTVRVRAYNGLTYSKYSKAKI